MVICIAGCTGVQIRAYFGLLRADEGRNFGRARRNSSFSSLIGAQDKEIFLLLALRGLTRLMEDILGDTRASKPKDEGLVIRDDERSEIKPVERVSRLGMIDYTSRRFESIVGLVWGHYGHLRFRLWIGTAGSWRIMPVLRAFSGSGRAGTERRHTSPCLGDFKGHIGLVCALPDSAPQLRMILPWEGKGSARAAHIISNLGDMRAEPGTQTNSNPLVRLRRSLR